MYLSRKRGDNSKIPKFPSHLCPHTACSSWSSGAKGLPEALGEEELQGGDRNATDPAGASPGSGGKRRSRALP